ncbi:hypothetical protein IP98_01340 [Flavobacterium cauense R2A-7]|uniref:Uncharacterized protein n=1 Tax=Flavobacterium cauense R2A-7 TaxID=1341154 RepID=A0A562LZ09_9FLAO|nr:hypothetical protein [Flavobacterium cauense]KGO80953.1 hypothetical protein Q762_09925 [Flavobacterium cauense R2A-7]TWI12866.1 hypothetical protein IP98_01340 [Flavobacterium cauense R2A-7]
MDTISKLIKSNFIAIAIGLFFYLLFLYFTYSGNRICDCESTEDYNPGRSSGHTAVNRFYHK